MLENTIENAKLWCRKNPLHKDDKNRIVWRVDDLTYLELTTWETYGYFDGGGYRKEVNCSFITYDAEIETFRTGLEKQKRNEIINQFEDRILKYAKKYYAKFERELS